MVQIIWRWMKPIYLFIQTIIYLYKVIKIENLIFKQLVRVAYHLKRCCIVLMLTAVRNMKLATKSG